MIGGQGRAEDIRAIIEDVHSRMPENAAAAEYRAATGPTKARFDRLAEEAGMTPEAYVRGIDEKRKAALTAGVEERARLRAIADRARR